MLLDNESIRQAAVVFRQQRWTVSADWFRCRKEIQKCWKRSFHNRVHKKTTYLIPPSIMREFAHNKTLFLQQWAMTFTRENEQNQTHFMSFIQRCVNFHTCLHPHQLFLNRLHKQSARSLVYTSREFILYGGTIQHWNMCWNILGRIQQQQQQEQAGIFSTLSTSVLVSPSRRLKKTPTNP